MANGTIIRLKVDRSKGAEARITEVSGRAASVFRGNGVTFQIAVYDNATTPADMGDMASLKLAYMPVSRTDDAVASHTGAIEDATFTDAQFLAGTHYHVSLDFSEADMNPVIAPATAKDFWLVCFGAALVGGGEVTMGGGSIRIIEDGTDNTVETPTGPDTPATTEDVDAAIAAKAVRYDAAQSLDAGEKAQAIANLGLAKNNLAATTDPGVGDDSADGYAVGSEWINVTLDRAFKCLDATDGAAVWKRTDNETVTVLLNNFAATTNPAATDDASEGYAVGSQWVNVTLDRSYRCVDATTDAAVWKRTDNDGVLNNFAATTDPGTGDDSGDGYAVGSQWVNVSADRAWICTDATTTAAVWERTDYEPVILNNYTATTDPAAGDDGADGYSVGSEWINVTLDKSWKCVDATNGAAVWSQTNAAASGGGANDITGVNTVTTTGNFDLEDIGKLCLIDTTGGAITMTIPLQSSVTWPANAILRVGHSINESDAATVAVESGGELAKADGSFGALTLSWGQVVTIYRVASNTWRVIGSN